MPDKNEDLLEEIKENHSLYLREWSDIRDAGDADMLMIADGPWPTDEVKARADKDNPRPCEVFDELGQYLNQTIGDMRQNKRAVKVTPTGSGANDKTAEGRAGIIRQIEYDSNAQTAYQTGCENMLKRGYGFVKLGSRYENPAKGFNQKLYVGTVPNPNTILVDPFAKEPDWSDMAGAFELDSYSEKEFAAKWPEADKLSFDATDRANAPQWITDRIQVAAYWKLKKKKRKQVQIDVGQGPVDVYLDEIPGAKIDGNQLVIRDKDGTQHAIPLLNSRSTEEPSVCQYITNGVEILETNPQKWIEIPIIPMFGPEEFVDSGSGAKRRLLSMVRKARGAYMGYCYARTTEIEILGATPKVPLGGYEGQFATNTPWEKINKGGLAYFEVKAKTTATGEAILPIPQRQLYDPPIQAYEAAAASFRLAIQTAMGIGGMLNGKRSQNMDAKSGKAIEALDKQESQGTFVFISNYERALARCGRMLEQGLTWCYDAPREVGTRSMSDDYSTQKINQDVTGENGETSRLDMSVGDHATTISVGPSEDSERDAAADLADSIMQLPNCPPKVMALAVKLRNVGPIGEEIADAFFPKNPEQDPAAQQQQLQGLQQKLQVTEAFAQSLHEQITTKAAELASKERIAHEHELTLRSIGLATIDAKDAQTVLLEELGITHKKLERAQELLMQANDHAHATATQSAAQLADATAQASDQVHADATQGSDQAHEAAQSTQSQQASADAAKRAQDAAASQTEPPQ